MAKIGIILELDSTYYEALSASKNYPDGTIDVVKVTDYEGGIKEAKKMVKDGTQILISRAGYILKLQLCKHFYSNCGDSIFYRQAAW